MARLNTTPVTSQLADLIPPMGLSEILPRINIATFQLPVPLGKWLLYTEMKSKCLAVRTRPHRLRSRLSHHDGGILRLAGLPRVRRHAAAIGPDWGLLRVLRAKEAEHHRRVPHGGQKNGNVPHIHVTDCQVPNADLLAIHSHVQSPLIHLSLQLYIWNFIAGTPS